MAVDKLVDSTQLDSDLTSVANAIRIKGGTSGNLAFPNGFVSAIQNIPSGGGGVEKKKVNFIDYDGTLLYSYDTTEINAMTDESDLPPNPSHDNLTAQGWNWTLAQIKAQLLAMPDMSVIVGQMYITASGDTEIDVDFTDPARLSPILTICVNGTITVNWGDNTTPDTITGTSLTSRKTVEHTYNDAGKYTIVISVVNGAFSFYGSSVYTLLRKNSTQNANRVYSNKIINVRLGSGITTIGDSAFNYCYSLATITIPNSVTTINNNTFQYCYSLKSVVIPSSVTTIPGGMFQTCYSIASIAIPGNVTNIGANAFYTCHCLIDITIPNGITTIGNNLLSNNNNIVSIIIPSSVTAIGDGAFGGCNSLREIVIPNGVTTIGNTAFQYCYSLKSVTIPSSVTTIGNSAFNGCVSLSSLIVPENVTSIGNNAFYGCYGVAEYHFLSTTVPTGGTTMFANIVSECIIYVPYSADHSILEAYKSATNWSTYASYMREEPTEP